MYVGEERISALTKVLAGLALIVACLGVFGLASFLADRKTKEIGIRKILGARMHQYCQFVDTDLCHNHYDR